MWTADDIKKLRSTNNQSSNNQPSSNNSWTSDDIKKMRTKPQPVIDLTKHPTASAEKVLAKYPEAEPSKIIDPLESANSTGTNTNNMLPTMKIAPPKDNTSAAHALAEEAMQNAYRQQADINADLVKTKDPSNIMEANKGYDYLRNLDSQINDLYSQAQPEQNNLDKLNLINTQKKNGPDWFPDNPIDIVSRPTEAVINASRYATAFNPQAKPELYNKETYTPSFNEQLLNALKGKASSTQDTYTIKKTPFEAALSGIKGEEAPTPIQAMSGEQLGKQFEQKHPLISGGINTMYNVALDPLTYAIPGAEGLGKAGLNALRSESLVVKAMEAAAKETQLSNEASKLATEMMKNPNMTTFDALAKVSPELQQRMTTELLSGGKTALGELTGQTKNILGDSFTNKNLTSNDLLNAASQKQWNPTIDTLKGYVPKPQIAKNVVQEVPKIINDIPKEPISTTIKEVPKEIVANAPKEKNTIMAAKMEFDTPPVKPVTNTNPVTISEGPENISKFRTNTIERSTMLPNEVKEQLPWEDFEYYPQKAADWQKKAIDAVSNDKQKVIDNIVNSKSISGGQQAHEAALITSDFLNEARQTGNYSKLKEWLQTVSEKTRETARALKGTDTAWEKTSPEGALSDAQRTVDTVEEGVKKVNPAKIKEVDKEAQDLFDKLNSMTDEQKTKLLQNMLTPKPSKAPKPLIDKVMELINLGAYSKDDIRDLIKAKKGLPILSQEDAKYITEAMDKANTLPAGSREQQILRAQVQQFILDKRPSTFLDKTNALRNISLLGNLKTNVRNVTGNAITGVLDNTANAIEATALKPVDWLMKKKTGMYSTALPNLKVQAKGAFKGASDAVSDSFGGVMLKDLKGKSLKEQAQILGNGFLNPIDTSGTVSKFETGQKLAFKNKFLRGAENAVNSALRLGDRPFNQAYYDDFINQALKANPQLKGAPTQEIIDTAKKVAAERTYQDDNTISNLVSGLKNLPTAKMQEGPLRTALQFGANSLIPYVKTPANILKRGLEYTPVGLIEGGLKLGSNLKNGTLTLAKQREIMDRLGRGVVGTGLIAGGYAAKKSGVATGSAPDDKDVAALQRQAGRLPNSINGYTVDWAQPGSTPFLAGVQMAQSSKDSGNLNAAQDALINGVNFYTDQPMLQSFQKLIGSQYDNKGVGQRVLESALSYPGQYIPTAFKQSVQVAEPNTKETYSPDKLQASLVNPILAKMPWLNQKLSSKIDTLGNPVQNPNTFNTLINPGNMPNRNGTDVENELLRLYDATGDKRPFPMVVNKTLTYTDKKHQQQKVPLTSEQYVQYQQTLGQATNEAYTKLMNNPIYKSATDEAKAKMLTNVLDRTNTAIRKQMIKEVQK